MQIGPEQYRPLRGGAVMDRGVLSRPADLTGLARAVSPRSAWRPLPPATMRCARARGDIRSGVTGSLCGGVVEPVRRGRRGETVYGARRGFTAFELCRW